MKDFIISQDKIKNASPLELPFVLMETELHDQQSSYELYEEVSKKFEGEGIIDNVVAPVITTMVDGILSMRCFKGVSRKMGLSAQRVMQECKNFDYDGQLYFLMPDSFVESKNNSETTHLWGQENRAEYIREKYENSYAMNKYKKNKIGKNGTRVNMEDEYLRKKNITGTKASADKRRNDPQNEYNAETDHIVPLHTIFSQVQNNCALSDGDIRRIANQDCNFAVTARMINNPKRDMSNSEFIKMQDELKSQGKPYIELSQEQRVNMIRMEQEAQAALNNSINETVLNNLTGQGQADRAERKAAMDAKEKELGRKLTQEEREHVDKGLAYKKATNIHKENTINAGKQSLVYMAGNVVLLIMKPLYYEIKDMILNGLEKGVCANEIKEALKIRFLRIKNYVWSQMSSIKGMLGSTFDLLKDFISALIEGLIDMFVGIFKKILRVLKEGIKIGMQVYPVLFGKESKSMSSAEKGDVIVKILGSSIVALCGIGINLLLEKVPLMEEEGRIVLSTIFSGLASILLFYVLDKADLFNVKKEKRERRIQEVFELRMQEIKDNIVKFNDVSTDAMRNAYLSSRNMLHAISIAAENNRYEELNSLLKDLHDYLVPQSKNRILLDWNC